LKTSLTEQQISNYRESGSLIIREFLGEGERTQLLEAIDTAVAQLGKQKIAGSNAREWDEEDSFYDKVFLQRLNLWKISPLIRELFTGEHLGNMICSLAGVPAMRIWHDQTLQKMPWANATAWHLDNPYWSFHSRDAISIWIALDDATVQNGCMYYLPGSHKLARFDNSLLNENMSGLFDIYPEFSEIEPVAAEMKAGDAGFHNGLTAHAAGPNMTPRPRRAMTCGFMPDGAVFNGQANILSDEYVAGLENGQPLQDEEQNPLVGIAQ
jgi:phytanoyl-CoA hydroxylase